MSLLLLLVFFLSAKVPPSSSEKLSGSWAGFYTPSTSSNTHPMEMFFWTDKGVQKGAAFNGYNYCLFELTLQQTPQNQLQFSAVPIGPQDRCYESRFQIQIDKQRLSWQFATKYDTDFTEKGELTPGAIGEKLTRLLSSRYDITPDTPVYSELAPLDNPVGWYMINELGLYEIIEDPRYRHTQEWKLVQMRALWGSRDFPL